jgi:RNA polymerase sigma-70 factor (ECF subfamily)
MAAMADPARTPGAPPPPPPAEPAPLPRPAPRPDPGDEAADRDRELLARIRRGDQRAFAELIRRHQDRVFDLGYRMLGDRQEAEDLSQEIFVAVHRGLKSFRGDSKLATWIFRVAKNHCLNRLVYLRRHGGGRTQGLDEGPEAAADPASARPDRQFERRERRAILERALSELDEAQRMIVVLRDIEGLDYEEIAAVLDEPLGTVKSRLHRARAALAQVAARLEAEEAR